MESREGDRAGRWGAKTIKKVDRKLEKGGMMKAGSDKLKNLKTLREQATEAVKTHAVPNSGTKYGKQNTGRVNAVAGKRSSGEKNQKEKLTETRKAPVQSLKYVKGNQKITKLQTKLNTGSVTSKARKGRLKARVTKIDKKITPLKR